MKLVPKLRHPEQISLGKTLAHTVDNGPQRSDVVIACLQCRAASREPFQHGHEPAVQNRLTQPDVGIVGFGYLFHGVCHDRVTQVGNEVLRSPETSTLVKLVQLNAKSLSTVLETILGSSRAIVNESMCGV